MKKIKITPTLLAKMGINKKILPCKGTIQVQQKDIQLAKQLFQALKSKSQF